MGHDLTTWVVLAQQVPQPLLDSRTMYLLAGILAFLATAFGVGIYLQRYSGSTVDRGLAQSFNHRIRAWWAMYALMGATLLTGSQRLPAVLFFFAISFWGLREFISLTSTRLGDHRALFWVFFIFTPLQYLLVWLGQQEYVIWQVNFQPARLFTNLIPVYAFLFIPARVAFSGDHKRFLERTAKIQSGLLVSVYALSHAPALLDLPLIWPEQRSEHGNGGLLVFMILVVQIAEVGQMLWNRWIGKRVIAPEISSNRTWEGFAGGIVTATLLGMGLWWVTPFSPLQAAIMSFVVAITGLAGSMTMSAIKRDRGVRDFGTLVAGHAGVLDRFDSICFASPVFFHIVRYFFTDL
jgi:phosphatidate cytidylyltransferase